MKNWGAIKFEKKQSLLVSESMMEQMSFEVKQRCDEW